VAQVVAVQPLQELLPMGMEAPSALLEKEAKVESKRRASAWQWGQETSAAALLMGRSASN